MTLPEFNEQGELPVAVYQVSLEEVVERFGKGSPQRHLVTMRLTHIYELAKNTGQLLRFVIFGSYVTNKLAPNDVDIILVMSDDLTEDDYAPEIFPMFDHLRLQRQLGASVFAIRPGFMFGVTVDEFIAQWSIKRDNSHRGIVEIIEES